MILDFAVITVVNGRNAFQLFGGVSNTDPRLSNARVPVSHTHSVRDIVDFPDLTVKEDKANKDAAFGYAGLDWKKQLNAAEIPTGSGPGTIAAGDDARLADARTPMGAASGDLSGSFPAPTVSGLQGNALPTPAANGFFVRSADNTTWLATTDVAPASELGDLRDNFRRLLRWCVETFGEVPPDLEDEYGVTGDV